MINNNINQNFILETDHKNLLFTSTRTFHQAISTNNLTSQIIITTAVVITYQHFTISILNLVITITYNS